MHLAMKKIRMAIVMLCRESTRPVKSNKTEVANDLSASNRRVDIRDLGSRTFLSISGLN